MLGFKNKTSETADAEKDAAKKNPKPKRSRFVKLLTIFVCCRSCCLFRGDYHLTAGADSTAQERVRRYK